MLVAVGFLLHVSRSSGLSTRTWRLAYANEDAAEYFCQDVLVPNGVESAERTACIDRWLSLGPGGALIDGLVEGAAWSLGFGVPGAMVLLLAARERRRKPARDQTASIP